MTLYSRPAQGSESISLLEVYKTDEENWEQYVPLGGATESMNWGNKEEETSEETEETEEELEDEDNSGFKLHQGEILETYYYGDFKELSFESDYKDISLSGALKFGEIKDLTRFYKGVRLLLRKKMAEPNEEFTAEDLDNTLLGFITEESFNESGMDITISGITKLLEQNYQFSFTQMKRSEILAEMIKTAGLEPVIDTTDLQDDIIDYTNVSSSGSSDEDSGDSVSAGGNIDSMVKKWIKGKKGALEKAKAIHEGLKAYGIVYCYYYNFHYNTAQECLDHAHSPGLNCGDCAQLTTACMKSAGLNAHIELRCDSAHFFTVIVINGTKYYSDLTGAEGARSTRAWNDTWQHNKCGNPYNR